MTLEPSVPWKSRARTAALGVLGLAAVAVGGDGVLGLDMRGDGGIVVELWGDPWADSSGVPSGGVTWDDTIGPAGDEIALSYGFVAEDLYGGICVADAPDGNSYASWFNALCLAEALNAMDPTCDAQPDVEMTSPDAMTAPPEGSQSNGFILPSSFGRKQFNRQPALTAIHARQSHRSATGEGVVVAVLDTGVDATHPLLAGRVLAGLDYVDVDEDASEGARDGVDQDHDGLRDDGFGHGTTVAGLVVAAAPDARILPVRVLDEEAVGTAARVASGIRWAADHGADVINLSLGGGYSPAIERAIGDAVAAGVVVVAAAGDSRASKGEPTDYPATDPRVLAISATAAAGETIVAPSRGVAGPYPENRWYRGAGTSFGTALATGGVALLVSLHPDVDRDGVRARLGAPQGGSARLDLLRLAR
jgi:subtilase family protein